MKISIFLKLFSGVALAQIIVFICTPFLANSYGAEAFGEFGFFFTIASVLAIIYVGRLDLAISKARTIVDCKIIITGIVLLSFCSVFLTFLICQLLLKDIINIEFWKLVCGGIGFGLFLISNSILIFNEDYLNLAKQKVTRALLTVSFQFILLFILPNEGLIIGCTVSYILASLIYLTRQFKPCYKRFWLAVSIALVKHKGILKYNLSNDLISAFSQNMPVFLAATVSLNVAGVYFLAERLIRTPIYLIASTIRPVIIRSFVSLDYNDKVSRYKLYIIQLFVFSIALFLVYIIISSILFDYYNFDEWLDLEFYMTSIILWTLASLINTPTNAFLTQTGRSKLLFYFEIVILFVRLVPAYLLFLDLIGFKIFVLCFVTLSVIGYLFIIVFVLMSSKIACETPNGFEN
ncbi:hypothetical protein [Aliamphritea ceti]|uniref:hypothetical protein n=1 Tax=Aliamphritea ceti TaxID=1524258 RepID=UPI0021C34D7C|nr:hypothetical protein [Aliamphritea ceti]